VDLGARSVRFVAVSRENYGGKQRAPHRPFASPRGHRAAAPCPSRVGRVGWTGRDHGDSTPPQAEAAEQIGGGKQESEKPKLSTRPLGSDGSETGGGWPAHGALPAAPRPLTVVRTTRTLTSPAAAITQTMPARDILPVPDRALPPAGDTIEQQGKKKPCVERTGTGCLHAMDDGKTAESIAYFRATTRRGGSHDVAKRTLPLFLPSRLSGAAVIAAIYTLL